MIVSRPEVRPPWPLLAAIAAVGLAVVIAGIFLFPLVIDEAYVTYSHARNFARGGRLIFHPAYPHFSAGSPLFSLLLGIGAKLGFPIPPLSGALGAAGIFGSSLYLMLFCYRHRMIWAAASAGLLLATSPGLWLTLGLENSLFLLLALAALYHLDRGHYLAERPVARPPVPLKALGAFFAVLIPAALYLTFSSGSSPLTTLQTQQDWAATGLSGVTIGSSFLDGLQTLLVGLVDRSGWYFLWLPFLLLGVQRLRTIRSAWGAFAWGGLLLAGAVWFSHPPFPWSYTSLLPCVALLPALGLQLLFGRAEDWDTLRYWFDSALKPLLISAFSLLLLLLVWPQAVSLYAMADGRKATEPPASPQTGVVPTNKGRSVYRSVGEWIDASAPSNATLAANSVGLIGLYVDLSGRLQPDAARAPMIEREADIDFASGLKLKRFATDRTQPKPGDWLRVRLHWQVVRLFRLIPVPI